ncbi:hypothetical protein AWRI1631_45990 [Saccharomyces cerevisiae AWRI1631]|uniref:Uncharacterized protein n=1 Tax=Saccharomyces cerevisiae (strain AWRI1631) TaxID=545124 RepID=B5VGR3_YEAS6|nr:hypothetical protein AWRI1631_45990 [Saccharomyces cerevisiae AWRI1631]
MLVWRLGQSSLRRFTFNSFSVSDNWWGDLQWNTSVVVFQILQTNFQMQFTGTSNDMFTGFRHIGQDTWIRLGQSLQTFDQFW